MDDLQTLKEELERLKKECEQLNRTKTLKKCEKLELETKNELQEKELDSLDAERKKSVQDLQEQQTLFQEELLEQEMRLEDLKEEKNELEQKLDTVREAFSKIQDNFVIHSKLPETNINFKGLAKKNCGDESMDIDYTCTIVSGQPFVMQGGQALLTFEDEKVAKSIIARKKHSLEIADTKVRVDALQPQLEESVKFEVNMKISNKKLKVTNLPKDIPEEILKDKVELAFYKSDVGGAEIEKVDYDRSNNTAIVTYLENGVAQRVLRNDRHTFTVGGATCEVELMPCVDVKLNKLQMFSGSSSRTVLLTGIKNVDDQEEEDVQDGIEIHFQKESNGGGEVESIAYSQNRKLAAAFEVDLK